MSAAVASGKTAARLRPRRHDVVLFVRRRSIPVAVGVIGIGMGLAFAVGHRVGRGGASAVVSAAAPVAAPAAPVAAPAAAAPVTAAPVAAAPVAAAPVAAAPVMAAVPPPAATPTRVSTASAGPSPAPAPLALLSTSSIPPARGYGVQLGAFPSREEAVAFLERTRGELRAWPVYLAPVELKGKGTWHRVRAGRFEAIKEAQALRDRLASDGIDGLVVAYP